MREYVYPKIPHHYHESVSGEFFSAPDLIAIEKLDGSNAKLVVYDDRYSAVYPDSIHDLSPTHGDVFVCSKKTVRGKLSDSLSDIDGAFHRLITTLRGEFNTEAALALHTTHESPLVFFGEHMLHHSIDYDYLSDPPPVFNGFDVLKMTAHTTPPANPFAERFDAFLPFEDMEQAFKRLGFPVAPIVDRIDSPFDVGEYTIPMSSYADQQAEGVVLRSDSLSRRVKYVSPEFRERNAIQWGESFSASHPGTEAFAETYMTNARVQKAIHTYQEYACDNNLPAETITEIAVADAWEEDLMDIQTLSDPLCPTNLVETIQPFVEDVIERSQINAHLNNTTITSIWTDIYEQPQNDQTPLNSESVGLPQANDRIVQMIETEMLAAQTPNKGLARLLNRDTIWQTAIGIANKENEEIGRWVIQPTIDNLTDHFWYTNINVIMHISIPFTPRAVNNGLGSHIGEVISTRLSDCDTVPLVTSSHK